MSMCCTNLARTTASPVFYLRVIEKNDSPDNLTYEGRKYYRAPYAGIGGGWMGDIEVITIQNAEVHAQGGDGASGIGRGFGNEYGRISITNSVVYAYAGGIYDKYDKHGADNKLYYATGKDLMLKSCRAYFVVDPSVPTRSVEIIVTE